MSWECSYEAKSGTLSSACASVFLAVCVPVKSRAHALCILGVYLVTCKQPRYICACMCAYEIVNVRIYHLFIQTDRVHDQKGNVEGEIHSENY